MALIEEGEGVGAVFARVHPLPSAPGRLEDAVYAAELVRLVVGNCRLEIGAQPCLFPEPKPDLRSGVEQSVWPAGKKTSTFVRKKKHSSGHLTL